MRVIDIDLLQRSAISQKSQIILLNGQLWQAMSNCTTVAVHLMFLFFAFKEKSSGSIESKN